MLLGQHRRFEVMDFAYHLLRVNRIDQKDETLKGVVSIKLYFELISRSFIFILLYLEEYPLGGQ